MCGTLDVLFAIFFATGFLVYADEVRLHSKIRDLFVSLVALGVSIGFVYLIWNGL